MTRILLVDDETAVLAALRRTLRSAFGPGLACEACPSAKAALALAGHTRFDVVLSDLRMPGMDGITLLARMAALQPYCIRMLLTASADFATAQRAINEVGLFRYLVKPWNDAELRSHFEAAIAAGRERLRAAPESPQEAERRRLEALEPGITQVEFGPQGEVLMPPWPELR